MRDVMKLMNVAVAVVLMIPSLSLADEYSYTKERSPGYKRAKSTEDKISGTLSGNQGSEDSLEQAYEDLKALREQLGDARLSQQELNEVRDRVVEKQKQIEDLTTALAIPDVLAQKDLEEEKDKSEALSEKIEAAVPPPVTPSNVDKNLPKSCDNGASGMLSQGDQMLQQFQTPFNFTKNQLVELQDEKNEKVRKALLKQIGSLAKHFKQQAKLQNKAKKKSPIGDDASDEEKIAWYEQKEKKQDKNLSDLNLQLVEEVFGKKGLFADLLNGKDERSDTLKISQKAATTFQDFTTKAQQQLETGVKQLELNCEHNMKTLGVGPYSNESQISSNPISLIDKIGVSFRDKMLNERNASKRKAEREGIRRMKNFKGELNEGYECPAVGTISSQIASQFATINGQIATMGAIKDGEELLVSMDNVLKSISSVQSNLGNQINAPLIAVCRDISKKIDEAKKFTTQSGARVASGARDRGRRGERRGSSRRRNRRGHDE